MHSVTRLDRTLYAWLAEQDDAKFERAFAEYYDAAFTGVVRYLTRRSSSADLDLEQIAVDALLKFFSRVGHERRQASESITDALPRVEPPDVGPLHIRQVRRWTADVGSFQRAAMTFTIDTDAEEESGSSNWKAEIDTLTQKIPPLQRQGCQLLEPLRAAVTGDADSGSADAGPGFADVREFAQGLRSGPDANPGRQAAVEQRYPGAARFADATCTVIDALPELRVPTNGYLFDIAQSLYLDECKARGRLKRGGSGSRGAAAEDDASRDASSDATHPFAQIGLDEDAEAPASRPAMVFGADAVDLESDQIGEEFCQKFYAYLRRPLDAAERAYCAAAAGGAAKAERKRWESLAAKTDRILTVLSMRVEGQTQDAIAEALGISRNQVKYIVELIQEAYEQFAAAGARTPVRASVKGEHSHVQ